MTEGAAQVAPPSSRLGLLQVCAAGVLWGTGGLVVTVLHERDGLGAMTVSSWRTAIAAAALLLFAGLTRPARLVETARRHTMLAVVLGVGTAAYQGLYFVSVLLVGVSVATVVSLGLAPILAALWEHATARTLPTPREAAVLVAALTGLCLVSAHTSGGTTSTPADARLGLVLSVAGGATYAAITIYGRHAAQRVDSVALTTCATTAGALTLLPFLAIAAAQDDPVASTDPGSLLLLAYLGVATMALAYGLLYAGLRTTSGSAATVATLVEPVSAALLAVALLGEHLAWPALLGGVLILGAVVALRPARS